jgi:hypothetical protein
LVQSGASAAAGSKRLKSGKLHGHRQHFVPLGLQNNEDLYTLRVLLPRFRNAELHIQVWHGMPGFNLVRCVRKQIWHALRD